MNINVTVYYLLVIVLLQSLFSCGDKSAAETIIRDRNSQSVKDSMVRVIDSLNDRLNGSYGRDIELVGNPSADTLLFKERISDYIFGLAAIEGYYLKQTRTVWDSVGEDCDCFVITNAPSELLKDLAEKIDKGNSINFRNEKNRVVINIKITNISENYRTLILNSNETVKIKMRVYFKFPERTCVETCYSSAEIISVE